MTKLLIALATTVALVEPAHAAKIVGFRCSGVYVDFGGYKDEGDQVVTFSVRGDRKSRHFKMVFPKEGGTQLWTNGKKCDVQTEELK